MLAILLFFTIKNTKPIYIYDANNKLVTTDTLYYEYTSIQEIHPNMIHAVIAIEDNDFYRHQGISLKRMAASLYQNIKSNEIVQGASTITQQYIKNTYLTNEKTFKRKINEIALALELEKNIPKIKLWKPI